MPEPRKVVLAVVVPMVVILAAVAMVTIAERSDDGDSAEPGGSPGRRPLVVLLRYGGPEGASDRVAVDSTGEAVITSDRSSESRTHSLSDADLTALRNALERSQIATLRRNYLDPRAEIAFQYDVTYQGVTVTADAGVVPEKLGPVVVILDRLLG